MPTSLNNQTSLTKLIICLTPLVMALPFATLAPTSLAQHEVALTPEAKATMIPRRASTNSPKTRPPKRATSLDQMLAKPVMNLHPRVPTDRIPVNHPVTLSTGTQLDFTYSVEWKPTTTSFHRRFDRYLDYDFFEHQIHWFSIFNSFMMVIFLTGIVSLILMRTLRKKLMLSSLVRLSGATYSNLVKPVLTSSRT